MAATQIFILLALLIVKSCGNSLPVTTINYWINVEDDARFIVNRGKINHILLDSSEKIKRLQIPGKCAENNSSYNNFYISWGSPGTQVDPIIGSHIYTYGISVDKYLKRKFLTVGDELSILVKPSNSLILFCNTTARVILFTNFSAFFPHNQHNGCKITMPSTLECHFPTKLSLDISTNLFSRVSSTQLIKLFERSLSGLHKINAVSNYDYRKQTYTLTLPKNTTNTQDLCVTWTIYISDITGLPTSVNNRHYAIETPLICYKYNGSSYIYTKFNYGSTQTGVQTTDVSAYNISSYIYTTLIYATIGTGVETTDSPAFKTPIQKLGLVTYKIFIIIIIATALLIASIGIFVWCYRKNAIRLLS